MQDSAQVNGTSRKGGPDIVSRWLLDGVRLQEQEVLERRPTFSFVAGKWRLENVTVKVPAENADLAIGGSRVGREADEATRTRVTKQVASEAAFLSSLKHANIIVLYGVTQHPSSDLPCLVLERLHESVEQRRRRGASPMTLRDVVDVGSNICDALQYLHHEFKPAVAHRDISSRNILLSNTGVAKLGGLSSARALAGKQPATKLPGDDEYMPPETALGDMPQYSTKIDNFSLGVLLVEMAVNKPPSPTGRFVSKARGVAIVPETKRRAEELAVVKEFHPRLLPLVMLCLQEEKRRPTSMDLQAAFKTVQSTLDYLQVAFTLNLLDPTAGQPSPYATTQIPSRFGISGVADMAKQQISNLSTLLKTGNQAKRPVFKSPLNSVSSLSPTEEDLMYEAPCLDPTHDTDYSQDYDTVAGDEDSKGYCEIDDSLTQNGTPCTKTLELEDSDDEWDDDDQPTYDAVDFDGTNLDRVPGGRDQATQPQTDNVDDTYEDGYRIPRDLLSNPDGPSAGEFVYQEPFEQIQEAATATKPSFIAGKTKKPLGISLSNPCYVNRPMPTHHYDDVTVPGPAPLDKERNDRMLFTALPMPVKKFHSHMSGELNSSAPDRQEMKLGKMLEVDKTARRNQYVAAPKLRAGQCRPGACGVLVLPVDRRCSDSDMALKTSSRGPPALPGEDDDEMQPGVVGAKPDEELEYEAPEESLLALRKATTAINDAPNPLKSMSSPDLDLGHGARRLPAVPIVTPRRRSSEEPSEIAVPSDQEDYYSQAVGTTLPSPPHSTATTEVPYPTPSPRSGPKSPIRSSSKPTLVPLSPVVESQRAQGPPTTHAPAKPAVPMSPRSAIPPPPVKSPPTRRQSDGHTRAAEAENDADNWFHGPLSREDAEGRLKHSPLGSFLVRSGRTHSGFTISWRSSHAGKPIKHVIVDQPRPGVFQLRHATMTHSSMQALLQHHKRAPVTNLSTDRLEIAVSS